MFDLTSIDLTKPHTVAVVTSRCRLPFARGMLGPGLYHFPGDYRKSMQSISHKRQLKVCELYYLAGDTASVVTQIAKLKAGVTDEKLLDPTDESANDEKTNGGVITVEEAQKTLPDIQKMIADNAVADLDAEIVAVVGADDEIVPLKPGSKFADEPTSGLMAINPDHYEKTDEQV